LCKRAPKMKLASFLEQSEVQLFVVFKAELCREGCSQSLLSTSFFLNSSNYFDWKLGNKSSLEWVLFK
jgi:hypothetical protein